MTTRVYAGHEDILAGIEWVATLDGRTTPICQALRLFLPHTGQAAGVRELRGAERRSAGETLAGVAAGQRTPFGRPECGR